MSSKGKMSTIRVAVCGLTSSSYNGLGGQGPGKSCLCNRLIQSTHDKLHMDHTSVLNLSEFGSNVINNTHFLYWGEKISVLEDGQEIKFQVVEHTEFVDDSSLKPFSTTKPYHKRCIQVKLQSGGKVTYLEPNQLALPEHYTDALKFPDKFSVDGFIVCVDVSTRFDDPSDPQKEFFDRLLQAIQAIKKPVVVACTKFDHAKPASVASILDTVAHSKKQVPVVEVSALKGVNVDTCFLVLAHLVDPKKPKTRIVPYAESKAQLDERIRRNEEAFQYVLDERLTDFSMTLEEISKSLKPIVEHQILIDLCGQDRVNKLIKAKLRYLKLQLVKSKTSQFVQTLPNVLLAMLPNVELEDTAEVAKTRLRRSSKFERYFVDVRNWKENADFLKSVSEDVIPFGILEEQEGKEALEIHLDERLIEVRAKLALEKIKTTLWSTPDILPGVDMTMLWVDLGLSEDVKLVSNEDQVHTYNEYMGKLEQQCVADLTELFLEKSDLFDEISSSPKDAFDRVHQELKSIPRYKRLDHRSQLRMSQALKHIGSLQMPEKSPAYSKSGLQDAIESLLGTGVLSQEKLQPGARASEGEGPCWEVDDDGRSLRLCILARTEDNAKILRSDFMNHFSGSGEVEIGDQTYRIDMSLQHGHHIHSLNTNNFIPHGAVAVVTSLECVDWLWDLAQRLWLFEVGVDKMCHAPCRGMPLIVLALDRDAVQPEGPSKPTSAIYTAAQTVAGEVQCVCIPETPTTQPMRLVVSTVIHQILLSLINAFSHVYTFLNSKPQLKDPTGFNVAVCTLVGDPYPNESLLNPLLRHQLVFCDNDEHTLFLKCAIEKQHRTCVFTFNSMFNVPALCNSIHLGFILVYSTQRPASLAVLKYLLAKLPNIPKLIVAMTASQSYDNALLKEGREVAKEWKAMFVCNNGQELSAGFAVDFLHKCWFRRFTSWQAQHLSDDARQQLRGRQARALPDRPSFRSVTPTSLPPPPPPSTLSSNRHSMGTILDHRVDSRISPVPTSPNTLPRSPVKPSFNKIGSDSDIYSDPVVSKIGKKATLERKKKLSLPTSPPFLSPPHALSPVHRVDSAAFEQSDYASVEDAVQLSELHAGMVDSLRRQPRRSPSMSPPPPPLSPPMLIPLKGVGEESGAELDTYDTVEAAQQRVKSPTRKGYDHLPADDSPPAKGYDHLVSPPRPPRTDLSPKTQGDPTGKYAPLSTVPGGQDAAPSEDVYDTLDEREGPMYATIDVVKTKKKAPPPRPPVNTIPSRSPSPAPAIHPRGKPRPPVTGSAGDSPRSATRPSPPHGHQRIKSDDLSLRHNTSATPSNADQLYSVVQKKPRPQPTPRRAATPEEPVYSIPEKKKKPPPIAPKPTSRSPTPTSERKRDGGREMSLKVPGNRAPGLSHIRSESLDAGILTATSAFRPDLMRTGRSHSLNQQHKIQVSPLRSPSPEIKTFSSLPSSYRNRARIREVDIPRARSKEELPQHHTGRERSPKFSRGSQLKSMENSPKLATRGLQANQYVPEPRGRGHDMAEPSEVEWEEDAPPLPARNYSWSDIEDNDDDILQSDDDLDDEPLESVTIMEHQQLYSTIRRLSIHTPNTIEAIYNAVNRIQVPAQPPRDSLLMDASRSQWLPHVAEEPEQVYDTLENMVSSISQPATAATAPTSWPEEAGVATTTAPPTQARESLPLTPRDIKLIKQQQKLMQKLHRKAEKEAEQRRRQDDKRRKREEELLRKEKRRFGKKGPKQKPVERSRYFGSPLANVVEDDGVPAFVRKCVALVEESSMTTVGLYRVSGKKEDCLALQEKFDQDPTLDITEFQGSCISSTLKAFFKLLPEPLVSNDIAFQLLVINSLDVESQRTRIHEILEGMAHPNLCTFHFMMQHLFKVQHQQDINKMTASNLAIVFWPTLIRPPLMDLADPGKQMGWQLVMTRIIEHPDFVPVAR